MLLKNEEVSKVFNQYFGHITDSLDLYEFPDEKVCEGLDDIANKVYKFRNHPSIVKIKEQYKVKSNFSFRLSTTEEIKAIIRGLPTNKAAGGEVPINILKKSNFSFDELTKCVHYALTNGKFPITLKNANVTPVHKKDDPTDKTNCRPVSESKRGVPQGSVLGPLLFNVFINDIFMFIEKSEICNFADDNTIYDCGKDLSNISENLKHDMKILLKWFRINSLQANPGKFQFMILGEKIEIRSN